jgi:hypothetical protein
VADVTIQPGQPFLIGYMDACPGEVLLEGHPERWHTIAIVLPGFAKPPPGLLSTVDPFHEVADAFRERTVHLKKWSRTKGTPYRGKFRSALVDVLARGLFRAFAFSFVERDARLILPDVLDRLDLVGLATAYTKDGRQRFRLGPFVRNGAPDYYFDVVENELAPLIVIADAVLKLCNQWLPSPPADSLDPHWLLFTDLISGDTHDDKRRTEFLQHAVRRRLNGVQLSINVNAQKTQGIGDVLSDNLAALLNDFLVSPTAEKSAVLRECRDRVEPGNLTWRSYSPIESVDLLARASV